jgi:hypothetical protein
MIEVHILRALAETHPNAAITAMLLVRHGSKRKIHRAAVKSVLYFHSMHEASTCVACDIQCNGFQKASECSKGQTI